ncbi:MAG: hypothetical protein AAGH65_01530 [Pseudomonadota bacterium]
MTTIRFNLAHAYPVVATLALLFLIAGCGSEPEPTAETEPGQTVIDPQIEAMERARAVEDQLQEAADARLEELDREDDG